MRNTASARGMERLRLRHTRVVYNPCFRYLCVRRISSVLSGVEKRDTSPYSDGYSPIRSGICLYLARIRPLLSAYAWRRYCGSTLAVASRGEKDMLWRISPLS